MKEESVNPPAAGARLAWELAGYETWVEGFGNGWQVLLPLTLPNAPRSIALVERLEDARLIAAAPELYDALKALRSEVERYAIRFDFGYEGSNLLEVMSDARAALQKAVLPPVAAKQKEGAL